MLKMFVVPSALDAALDLAAENARSAVFQANAASCQGNPAVLAAMADIQASLDQLEHHFAPVVLSYQRRARRSLVDAWAAFHLAKRDLEAATDSEQAIRRRMLRFSERVMVEERDAVSQAVRAIWLAEITAVVSGLRAVVVRINGLLNPMRLAA